MYVFERPQTFHKSASTFFFAKCSTDANVDDHIATTENRNFLLCARNHQRYRGKPSGKLFLTVIGQANPNRDKMTEKIQLPVGLLIEIISLTGFP